MGEGVPIPTWEREYLYLHGRGSIYTYMGEGVSIFTWEREYMGEGVPIPTWGGITYT